MKIKTILLGIVLLTVFTSVAQNKDRNKVKAFKTAYITNALELTVDEAEKFWPIYNAYDKIHHELKIVKTRQLFRKIRAAGGIDKLNTSEADVILKGFSEIDFNVANAKKKLIKDLTGIISSKKMIKLIQAEHNFNKELLKQFRNRNNMPRRN